MDSQGILGALWFLVIAVVAGWGYINPRSSSRWLSSLSAKLGFEVAAEPGGAKVLQASFGLVALVGVLAAGAILCTI